jgi:hypothetical protein
MSYAAPPESASNGLGWNHDTNTIEPQVGEALRQLTPLEEHVVRLRFGLGVPQRPLRRAHATPLQEEHILARALRKLRAASFVTVPDRDRQAVAATTMGV